MLTEKQIDMIAETVYHKHTAKIAGDDQVSNLQRKYVEISSKVVADMLKEYQKALAQNHTTAGTH